MLSEPMPELVRSHHTTFLVAPVTRQDKVLEPVRTTQRSWHHMLDRWFPRVSHFDLAPVTLVAVAADERPDHTITPGARSPLLVARLPRMALAHAPFRGRGAVLLPLAVTAQHELRHGVTVTRETSAVSWRSVAQVVIIKRDGRHYAVIVTPVPVPPKGRIRRAIWELEEKLNPMEFVARIPRV